MNDADTAAWLLLIYPASFISPGSDRDLGLLRRGPGPAMETGTGRRIGHPLAQPPCNAGVIGGVVADGRPRHVGGVLIHLHALMSEIGRHKGVMPPRDMGKHGGESGRLMNIRKVGTDLLGQVRDRGNGLGVTTQHLEVRQCLFRQRLVSAVGDNGELAGLLNQTIQNQISSVQAMIHQVKQGHAAGIGLYADFLGPLVDHVQDSHLHQTRCDPRGEEESNPTNGLASHRFQVGHGLINGGAHFFGTMLVHGGLGLAEQHSNLTVLGRCPFGESRIADESDADQQGHRVGHGTSEAVSFHIGPYELRATLLGAEGVNKGDHTFRRSLFGQFQAVVKKNLFDAGLILFPGIDHREQMFQHRQRAGAGDGSDHGGSLATLRTDCPLDGADHGRFTQPGKAVAGSAFDHQGRDDANQIGGVTARPNGIGADQMARSQMMTRMTMDGHDGPITLETGHTGNAESRLTGTVGVDVRRHGQIPHSLE